MTTTTLVITSLDAYCCSMVAILTVRKDVQLMTQKARESVEHRGIEGFDSPDSAIYS